MNYRHIICIFLAIAGASCSQIQKATDVITQPTAREVYARNFDKDDVQYKRWDYAFAKAYTDSTASTFALAPVDIPFASSGTFKIKNSTPLTYIFEASRGEQLEIVSQTTVDSAQVFLNLYKLDAASKVRAIKENEINSKKISHHVDFSGHYLLIVQPEIYTTSPFTIQIFTRPTLRFPVTGKTAKAVQSFWGDQRDGGRRSHKGIDIFAKRGTPLIAATDGRVSRIGDYGLGGKQVWLRDGLFGKSLYYAHLDSITARSGQRVKVGDTLGFVGNTGNARTTSPHLHFGIYTRSGAVDPLPFLKASRIANAPETPTLKGVVLRRGNVRSGASTKNEILFKASQKDTVTILERQESWYRMLPEDSLQGYIHSSLLKELNTN